MNDVNGRICLDGQKIKSFRKQQCLSQKMLIEKCRQLGGVLAIATLKRAESNRMILYRTAHDIAMALGLEVNDLILNDKNSTSNSFSLTADSSQIVGRTAQILQARHILEVTQNTQKGNVLYIRGDAGVGKSLFSSALTDMTKQNGFATYSLAVFEEKTSKNDLLKELVKRVIFKTTEQSKISPQILQNFIEKFNLNQDEKKLLFKIIEEDSGSPSLEEPQHYAQIIKHEIMLVLKLMLSHSKATALIIEDIHWADDNLLNMLKSFTTEIYSSPILLILTSRIEKDPLDRIWKGAIFNTPFTTIVLPPLSTSEAQKMAETFDSIPEDYRQQCLTLAQGNPLFLTQLLKNHTHNFEEIPGTLTQLVKFKLKGLSVDELKIINIASALGHEFHENTLRNIDLSLKCNLNNFLEKSLFVSDDYHTYQFAHDLIRKGIYDSLEQEQKSEIHHLISQFYESNNPTLYAHHLKQANHNKAEEALQNAAEFLYEKHNYSDALTQVDLAMSIKPGKKTFPLIFLKGILLKLLDLPAKSTSYFEKALLLASNNEEKLKVCLELTDVYAVNQRFERSEKYLDMAEELSKSENSREVLNLISKYRLLLLRMKNSMNSVSHLLKYSYPDNLNSQLNNLNDNNSRTAIDVQGVHEVAILHSTTGSLKELEAGVLQMTIMALDEINQSGGLLDHKINYRVFDGASNEVTFKTKAIEALTKAEVTTIFGSSTSSSRKQVKEVVEEKQALLVYPFQYEGLEESPNIAYIGPPPNLQALPAIDWLINQNKQKFFFVGSDYIYPLVTNEILRDNILLVGAEVIGEAYVPLGATDFKEIIENIKQNKPDSIVLTLVGLDSNKEFLKLYYDAGLHEDNITILSLVLSENDLCEIPIEHSQGIYSLFSYFQNHEDATNDDFVRRFQARYGMNLRIGGYMESAYVGVHLWAKAVQKCQSFSPNKVIQALKGVSHYAPGGIAYMDESNHHVWRYIRIAQVGPDGEFHVVWNSQKPIAPEPFPPTRSIEEWQKFLDDIQLRWDGQWEKQNESNH